MTAASKKIVFDLQMDLDLLRRIKAQTFGNPFVRGCPCFRIVAIQLADADRTRFGGLSAKAVKDRILLLLDHHKAGDDWKKRQ